MQGTNYTTSCKALYQAFTSATNALVVYLGWRSGSARSHFAWSRIRICKIPCRIPDPYLRNPLLDPRSVSAKSLAGSLIRFAKSLAGSRIRICKIPCRIPDPICKIPCWITDPYLQNPLPDPGSVLQNQLSAPVCVCKIPCRIPDPDPTLYCGYLDFFNYLLETPYQYDHRQYENTMSAPSLVIYYYCKI